MDDMSSYHTALAVTIESLARGNAFRICIGSHACAYGAATQARFWDAIRDVSQDAIRDASLDAIRDVSLDVSQDAGLDVSQDASLDAIRDATTSLSLSRWPSRLPSAMISCWQRSTSAPT